MKRLQFFDGILLMLILFNGELKAQNSMTGDGFGGRLWYTPYNYTVGSYSAYTVCGEERQLWGWGQNSKNQLGNPSISNTVNPVKAIGMTDIAYYSTGYLMGAIKTDKSGWIWGNSQDQGIKVIDDTKFVDAGANSCAFVKMDGTVWSVGSNMFGEFGNGASGEPFSIIPSQMIGISNAVRTAQGLYSTVVLLDNGEVMVSGSNSFGALGNGIAFPSNAPIPIQITSLKDIIDIKANTYGILALDKNGDVWVWGMISNYVSSNVLYSPIKLEELSNIIAISGCNDGYHFLALDKDKKCFAFGNNSFGQCGDGTSTTIIKPKVVAEDVVEIMAGEWFSYIIKTNGSLWATGFANPIWLNLPIQERLHFTQLDPSLPEFSLCQPLAYTAISSVPKDSIKPPLTHVIYMPNAFSPNGDGHNNIFRPILKTEANIDHFSMKVYSRWGELIFNTTNKHSGWDGSYFARPAEVGTYFYYVEYNQLNKAKQYLKGDVTLIR